ncbi:response regulator receiver protein [Rippkaea orientalis PCC 8801]|uniref:Response regulator receiver protein n=1 Tax=Rippkaea orientalis (strain PCC 8801 / RF-1) TaxID=41431 RepID=B7K0K4_RIPO1|nr:response regulator [Rippkaea orientalis]ACK67488.1 response regulator receiver protein [Rippkaea orientalis PCC 8801]
MSLILIVEDEPRLAAFMEKGLQKQGFKTLVASDGEQALSITQTENFDLLLLDLGLPVMDGWSVLQQLRSQGNRIPVIVVSAVDEKELRTKGKQYNVTEYITKPFRFQDLLRQVYQYLPKS